MSQEVDDNTLFPSGARWLRADFHLHTHQDKEFKYSGQDSSFIPDYVSALKTAKVELGVITNHNKFDRTEFKALRRGALKEGIYLLPGIELSVNDGANGVHVLVVFNEQWIDNKENTDYIIQFLTTTFAGKGNYDTSNARSNHSLLETLHLLETFGRDFFVVFAHVEQKSGLWCELEGGRLSELGKNELFRKYTLGFQKVRTDERRKKVQSWLDEFYPAEVEGSDAKSVSEIGKGQATYLKLGAFNFEALKFALLDYTHRLSNHDRSPSHSRLTSIRFDGGILDGHRFNLSTGMNCLIGIRGSGKSAILESLRYALGLQFGEKAQDKDYKTSLVEFALGSGGKVILEARNRDGEQFEVHRILNEHVDVYYQKEFKPGLKVTETVLTRPLYFGQKDLASSGEGFERDLVEKLVGDRLESTRKSIEMQKAKVTDVIEALEKLRDLEDQEKDYENQLNDANFQLQVFQKHGVEGKLKRQVQFEADARHVDRILEAVGSYLEELRSLVSDHQPVLKDLQKYSSAENAIFFTDLYTTLDKVLAGLDTLKEVLLKSESSNKALSSKKESLESLKNKLKEEFAQIARELTQQLRSKGASTSLRPDSFVLLAKTVDKTTLALAEIRKSKQKRAQLNERLLKELKTLNDLWHKEYREIEARIQLVNSSQHSLDIQAEYKGDKAALLDSLKAHLRGSRIREPKLKEVVESYPDFTAMYQSLDVLCDDLGEAGSTFKEYFLGDLRSLLTLQTPNKYKILYRGKELRHHSLGQRASALILFILSQKDNDVIIIDQPEDDLDNQTIYEDVIKVIKQLKEEVQFIFATHNANFPVLGDADQVIACSFSDDKVHPMSGSVDLPEMQKQIVDIMEGGPEAFRKRKEIYQIWKQ